ncbi:MAG: pseudouridine synthase, partial [Verrucomicrobia bacterium]|nr:pseudouridine synthase [Verrucomicrobiota bacterium]
FLPAEWGHLFTVGRLDYGTEGLLFLTNDGDFCLKLTHPRYGVDKIYHAVVEGEVRPDVPARMRQGMLEGGDLLKTARAKIISSNHTRSVLELVLAEGKNREVRRLLGALGLNVERLVRVQIGRIRLGDLAAGRWRTLTETEITSLLGNYENDKVASNRVRRSAGPGPRRRQRAGR